VYKIDGFTIRYYVPFASQCDVELQAGYKVPYDVITLYEQTQSVESIRKYLFEYTSSDVSIKNTVIVSKWTDQSL
jgi:hypothetical protein